MAKTDLTAARLRELFTYNPETGFFHRARRIGRFREGTIAGTTTIHGYVSMEIDNWPCFAHRLAWLYCYGAWPADQIDHINGIRSDNRITNLRDVSRSTNMQNLRTASVRNKSGLLGVSQDKFGYSSSIMTNGKLVRLGRFRTAEEAHAAYLDAKRVNHIGNTL